MERATHAAEVAQGVEGVIACSNSLRLQVQDIVTSVCSLKCDSRIDVGLPGN
jgi:hypothetical protein